MNSTITNITGKSFEPLAKLMLKYNIDYNQFCYYLRSYYVNEVYACNKSVTRTSLMTGVDRRIVSSILKNNKQYLKPSSLMKILNSMFRLAHKKTGLLNKKGKRSLTSIIESRANGSVTMNSVVDELIRLGAIEDYGHKVRLIKDKKVILEKRGNELGAFIMMLSSLLSAGNSLDKSY